MKWWDEKIADGTDGKKLRDSNFVLGIIGELPKRGRRRLKNARRTIEK